MTFDAPLLLPVALPVALAFAGLAWWARSARVRHAGRWSAALQDQARRSGRGGIVLLATAALAGLVALAGPRWGSSTVVAETRALNLVIAVDVSRSMLAEDAGPSRLERARRETTRLIFDLAGDRIGLIAFAGQSFILSPLTVDVSALQLLATSLDPDISSAGGTELSRVLRQGGELLGTGTEVADRVLVIFTDGESHDSLDQAVQAARELAESGVRLVLVAVGGTEPALIPIPGTRPDAREYYRDQTGELIRTVRRDDIINRIADAGRAQVVTAEVADQAGVVRDLIANFKRAPQASAAASQRVSRAWIPARAGVVLLLIHTFTRRTAALAGLALMLAPGGEARAQAPVNRGDAAWTAGDFRAAAEAYAAEARQGHGGDTVWFNAGTAGLAANDTALAAAALGQAARSRDPDIRFRALYNLGLLHLRNARADQANEPQHLALAQAAYREALLLRPGDSDAKWNYELTLRPEPPSESGGENDQEQEEDDREDQGETQPDSTGAQQESEPQEQAADQLTQSQAEQILNSIAEEERDTRERVNRRRRSIGETLRARDW